MLFKIAIKNLVGAGLRTWLNVLVTSISLFTLIFFSGTYDGMRAHALNVTIQTEFSGGSYWHPDYEPTDPLTFEDAHSSIPIQLNQSINEGNALAVLVSQATIYPDGRMIPVVMKGITTHQQIIDLPTSSLTHSDSTLIPVLIGKGMANYSKLDIGDTFIVRWLDINKTYDAAEAVVVSIMNTENFSIDAGHIWLPISKLQSMLSMRNHATYITHAPSKENPEEVDGWIHRDLKFLTRDMEALIEADEPQAAVIYAIMLALAAMGIFNAQVLAIFKRTKEIGTLIALGMTKKKIVTLFTLEGLMNAVLATIMTLILFGPVLWYFSSYGIPLPIDYSEMGMNIPSRLTPVLSIGLIVKSTLTVFIIVLIASYIPARKISKLEATDALRGRVKL